MHRIDPSFFSCTFNVNITFENYLNKVNTLINSHAPLKNSTKNSKVSTKTMDYLLKEFKMQLKRKIGSLKIALNVVIVIKIFFIKNMKHIETACQLY